MSYSTILFNLISPQGQIVKGQAIIRDGFSFSTFSDPNLARQLFEYDLDRGEDVAFNQKHQAYIKKYKGMTKRDIVKELKKELIKAGGKLVE